VTAPSTADSVLAIDVGTTTVKAAIVHAQGEVLWRGSQSQGLATPRPGWAEQDAGEWWRILDALAQGASREALSRVAGVCVTAHNPTLVCVGPDGVPRRPAITWADSRAAAEARDLSERLGRPVDPSMLVPKAMWLARHEPDVLADTRLLQGFDYLAYRLTGKAYALSAVPGWPAWDLAQLEAAGLPAAFLPSPGPAMGAPLGEVTREAADLLRLPAGIPVIAGLVDGLAAWIGTATLQPGELYAGAGTSAGVNVCWPARLDGAAKRIFSLPHPFGGRFMPGGPMSSGSRFLEWLAHSVCRVDIPTLVAEASDVAPGSDGLLALPYLAGERTPMADPSARAVFVGLDNRHTRAHLARAAMESVAFAIRDVMDVLLEAGAEVHVVHVGGGGSKSAIWNQIKADVLRRPVIVPRVPESSLMGAAVVAAWGAGLHASGDDAANAMIQQAEVYEPREAAIYEDLFALFRSTYRRLQPEFASLQRVAGVA
jgi:xylulokinase